MLITGSLVFWTYVVLFVPALLLFFICYCMLMSEGRGYKAGGNWELGWLESISGAVLAWVSLLMMLFGMIIVTVPSFRGVVSDDCIAYQNKTVLQEGESYISIGTSLNFRKIRGDYEFEGNQCFVRLRWEVVSQDVFLTRADQLQNFAGMETVLDAEFNRIFVLPPTEDPTRNVLDKLELLGTEYGVKIGSIVVSQIHELM